MIATAKKTGYQKVDIGSVKPRQWAAKNIQDLKEQAKQLAAARTTEQRIKNELAAIKYKLEDYIHSNEISENLTIEKVLMDCLKVLDLSFRKFAFAIDTTDGNLKKYISGQRKFNTDLAMRFGNFFHTDPGLWLHLDLKNELTHLKNEKQDKRYKKYSYEKVV